MELFLDTYERHTEGSRSLNAAGDDVRTLVKQVTDLMAIDPTTHAPPVLLFTWGSLTFTCVLTRATQRFIMFLPRRHAGARPAAGHVRQYRNADLEAKEVKRETADYTKVHVGAGRDAALRSPTRVRQRAAVAPDRAAQRHRRSAPLAVGRTARGAASSRTAIPTPARCTRERRRALRAGVPSRWTAARAGGAARLGHVALAADRLEGVDRFELTLANERLRWLDSPLLTLDRQVALSLGYAPDPLAQVFVGDIVGHDAAFPRAGRRP